MNETFGLTLCQIQELALKTLKQSFLKAAATVAVIQTMAESLYLYAQNQRIRHLNEEIRFYAENLLDCKA